jgi:MFS family permease
LWLAGCAGALAFLGWAGILNPILLLVGVFVLGLGFAVNAPVWASLVPQLVTDEELPSALTLGGVQLNITGILGPALAGILLARVQAPFVFALNAAGFLLVFMAIPALPKTGCALGRTLISFVRSIAISVRYVGQTPNVRNILLRNAIFSSLVVVIPALMPVVLLKGSGIRRIVTWACLCQHGSWLSRRRDLCHTLAAVSVCDRPVDDDRPDHARMYLCSHGDGSPLPLLPGSDGVSRRELDSRSL